MREFGLAAGGAVLLFSMFLYSTGNDLSMENNKACYGECYEEYVKLFGDTVENEKRKQQLAAGDPFSDIRGLWSGCAACHGTDGAGGIGPRLKGQTGSYITEKLAIYRDNGIVGDQSALMWGQAAKLTDTQIDIISQFVEEGLPG